MRIACLELRRVSHTAARRKTRERPRSKDRSTASIFALCPLSHQFLTVRNFIAVEHSWTNCLLQCGHHPPR